MTTERDEQDEHDDRYEQRSEPMPMAGGSGVPGEILHDDDPVEVNPGRPVLTLVVRNTGDRPVQVGSHYHFAACNPALDFDRTAAWGMRLAVPAGTAARFEPGVEREVDLVPLGGSRVVPGLRPEHAGPLDARDVPDARDAPDAPDERDVPGDRNGPGDDGPGHNGLDGDDS
jgi:urease subunit beta